MELLVVEFVSLNRDGSQAPPFSCSPNGHSLFFCWVCHSVLSIVNYWLIICVHEGECHHAEKKSFMLVSWKNGTMENAKAAYFWLQNSHALLEPLGTTYMHMIPRILCLLLISPHLAPSRELEDREELEMLSKNAPGMQHAIFLLGKVFENQDSVIKYFWKMLYTYHGLTELKLKCTLAYEKIGKVL